ncbi:MAG: V-type ATP synthase subunit I [Gammaproteobacteria bacterium]
MAVEMRHLTVQVLTRDLPDASLALARLGRFCPEPVETRFEPDTHADEGVQGERAERELLARFEEVPGGTFREVYRQARVRMDKLLDMLPPQPPVDVPDELVCDEDRLASMSEWLGDAWRRCAQCSETRHRMDDAEAEVNQLEAALADFSELDLDLGDLQDDKHFIRVRVGAVSTANSGQLRDALSLAGHLMFTFSHSGESEHVIVVGPRDDRGADVDSVLETAGFRMMDIPPELHDQPDRLRRNLAERRDTIATTRKEQTETIAAWAEDNAERLMEARRALAVAAPFVEVDSAARARGNLSVLQGWLPAPEVEDAVRSLKTRLVNPFHLSVRRPRRSERGHVPAPPTRNPILKPFATLVHQYGIPRYGEFDPTLLFALTFVAMFGMMFGDIGHGLVYIALGLLFRRTLGRFTIVVVGAGLSATLFGWLYGSIFGYEHLIHPLWISPLSDPLYMLSMALAWGVGFLVLGAAINIRNRLVDGQVNEAMMGAGGVLSVVMYLGLLYGAWRLADGQSFGWLAGGLVIVSLGFIVLYQWFESDAPFSERLLVVFIETFEVVTGYISSSLSFLRVAAFSLNHVALALAVFTLADMMEGFGHWAMVVGGNLFIMVLEGGIVTIQTLRLEYYEGFSRYFSGDGRPYKPLKLRAG